MSEEAPDQIFYFENRTGGVEGGAIFLERKRRKSACRRPQNLKREFICN